MGHEDGGRGECDEAGGIRPRAWTMSGSNRTTCLCVMCPVVALLSEYAGFYAIC